MCRLRQRDYRQSLVVAALLAFLSAVPAAAAQGGLATSGQVVAHTRRTVGGKTTLTIAKLWFTRNRYRLETSYDSGRPVIEVYNGRAAYRWTEGARNGRVWHPTGLNVIQDVVHPLLEQSKVPHLKRIGTARVAGLPCTIYSGVRQASATPGAWWKGALAVRIWRSQDRRFPYVLRTTGADAKGNRVESEVIELRLNLKIPEDRFRPSTFTQFLPPPDVRRGRQLIAAPLPIGPVAIHLADPLKAGKASPGRRVVSFAGQRLALEPRALAGTRDLQEARLEPHAAPKGKPQEAIVLYLSPAAAARVARTGAKARGRYLVVLVGGKPVAAPRIQRTWPEEENRVYIVASSAKQLSQIAATLQGPLRSLSR